MVRSTDYSNVHRSQQQHPSYLPTYISHLRTAGSQCSRQHIPPSAKSLGTLLSRPCPTLGGQKEKRNLKVILIAWTLLSLRNQSHGFWMMPSSRHLQMHTEIISYIGTHRTESVLPPAPCRSAASPLQNLCSASPLHV